MSDGLAFGRRGLAPASARSQRLARGGREVAVRPCTGTAEGAGRLASRGNRMAWTEADAAHLLRRAGFGGSLEDVSRLHALGRRGAVEALVDYASTPDTVWDDENPYGFPDVIGEWNGVRLSLLYQMFTSRRPLEARLLWFWHSHFTTAHSVVGNVLLRRQMDTWRAHATGRFETFLDAMYRDGAMLVYLNGSYSSRVQPNENFAREVQELYTTGTGSYDESDVRSAARAFTGWVVSWPARDVSFDASRFDDTPKTFRGQTGNLDGSDIMRILARQPETARHVCAKLYRAFVSERVNLIDVTRLARRWHETDGNIRAVLLALFDLPSFWDPRVRGFVFKTPLEFCFGLAQRLGIALDRDRMSSILWMSAQMGQAPFDPPNPAGYPGGLALTGAGMLLARTRAAHVLVNGWANEDGIARLVEGVPTPASPATLMSTVATRLGIDGLEATTRDAIAKYLGASPVTSARLLHAARGTAFLLACSPDYQVM
ncbi:MAG: DUF1800 family protein [Betaproteobacteria bacterium]|nr:DUF1800 family protein [Betaproteobacteria bacterium]